MSKENSLIILHDSQDEEIDAIASMVKSVSAASFRDKGKGFIVFAKDAEWYRRRIEQSHIVGILKSANKVLGFFCGVPSSEIDSTIQNSTVYNEAYSFVQEWTHKESVNDYFFLDQLVIDPAFHDQGFGKKLLSQIQAQVRSDIFIDVLEKPLVNPRLMWWKKRGFLRIGEVREKLDSLAASAFDGKFSEITWGLYHLGARIQ